MFICIIFRFCIRVMIYLFFSVWLSSLNVISRSIHVYKWHYFILFYGWVPGGSDRKESAHGVGDLGLSLGQDDPLEKGMVTHANILAWVIPWTCLTGYSPWSHKESDMMQRLTRSLLVFHCIYMYIYVYMYIISVSIHLSMDIEVVSMAWLL